jgi:hypothetical protein
LTSLEKKEEIIGSQTLNGTLTMSKSAIGGSQNVTPTIGGPSYKQMHGNRSAIKTSSIKSPLPQLASESQSSLPLPNDNQPSTRKELIYDADLKCYFDPETNEYYELDNA